MGIDKAVMVLYNVFVTKKRRLPQDNLRIGGNTMKEKRIFAMFITSVVTLVASLAITFGISSSLADRALATGLTRYEFNLGGQNNSLVTENEYNLSIANPIVYKPSGSVEWEDGTENPELATLFFEETYDNNIMYQDASYSSRVTVIPFKITNEYSRDIHVNLKITFGEGSDATLSEYTFVKIYDFTTGDYRDYDTNSAYRDLGLKSGNSLQYAIVIFSNNVADTTGTAIDWDNAFCLVNVEFEMLTPNPTV